MLRINRNIVECKYASYTGASGTWAIELIETLWNVNLNIVPIPFVNKSN